MVWMNQIPDPRIANIVYNFLGYTLAQLNEIDKNNLSGENLKALKTDPKRVFSMSKDASMDLMPALPPEMPPPVQPAPVQHIPQATVVAAPSHNVVNAGMNVETAPQQIVVNKIQLKNSATIKEEVDKIISALSNIKNLLDE